MRRLIIGLIMAVAIYCSALAANGMYVNDAGTWKQVQAQYVNDAGTWKLLFTLNGNQLVFTWEMTTTTNLTGFTIYRNGTPICTSSSGSASTLTCTTATALPSPAVFWATSTSSVDGESLPSNKIWAAGYPGWAAAHAYSLGDKISAGDTWALSSPLQVTRAGTSGATIPTMPVRKVLFNDNNHTVPSASSKNLNLTAATNLGSGLVGIPITAHGFVAGRTVVISGTTNYNGTYVLPAQTLGGVDVLVITKTYAAETFAAGTAIQYVVAADLGSGLVGIPIPSHGFSAGESVVIAGTVAYNGTQTLPAQTLGSADMLVITATYAAELFAGGTIYRTGSDVVDNANGTVNIKCPAHGYSSGQVITLFGTTNYGTSSKTINTTAATDLGGGLVGIPITAHGWYEGKIVTIAGTTSYNGTYTLPAQTLGSTNVVVIAKPYVAETFAAGTATVMGKAYTLGTQASADWLTLTATYVAERVSNGYAVILGLDDPNSGGVGWTLVLP